jgi:hypothetical protein
MNQANEPGADTSGRAPHQPQTYTPEEAVAIIGGGCKASWLRQGAREGRFPFTWIGKYAFTAAQISEIVAISARQPKKTGKPAATPEASTKHTPSSPLIPAPGLGMVQLRARQPRNRNGKSEAS